MNIRPYQFSARDFFRITRVFTLRVGRKGGAENEVLSESRQAFEVAAARTFGPILYCLVKLAFFECEHPSVNKPMVKTEPTVPSTRL